MLPALCLNKISFLIVIVIISSCIQFSYHQQQPQFPFSQLNQFKVNDKNNVYSQSRLQNRNWLHPGQELVFVTTTSAPVVLKPGQELIFITTTAKPQGNSKIFINNQPAIPTLVPFIPAATTPTLEFLKCFIKCPTTSEFNPICASNRQLYGNEQKFNCARQCGADIKIVRRGSCEGLFPMARG